MKKLSISASIFCGLAAVTAGAVVVVGSNDSPSVAAEAEVSPRVAFEQHLAANAAEAQRQADVKAQQVAERQAQVAERQAKLNEAYRVAAEAIAEATEAAEQAIIADVLAMNPNFDFEGLDILALDGMTREEAHGYEVIDHESGFFTVKFGESVEGRDMIAHRLVDNPEGTTDLAVYAVTHGTETQMLRWVDRWMTPGYEFPSHLRTLWVIPSINPDGHNWLEKGTVHNARHVNLNRNFGTNWVAGTREYAASKADPTWYASGHYYGGPSAMSEPESQATEALWAYLGEMDLNVYGHQPWGNCDIYEADVPEAANRFCATIGYPVDFAARPGTITEHAMAMGAGPSWVFEYPYHNVSEKDMEFHADQYLMIGSEENPL